MQVALTAGFQLFKIGWTEMHMQQLLDLLSKATLSGATQLNLHQGGLTRDEASAGITAVKEASVQALLGVQDWRAQYAVFCKHLRSTHLHLAAAPHFPSLPALCCASCIPVCIYSRATIELEVSTYYHT